MAAIEWIDNVVPQTMDFNIVYNNRVFTSSFTNHQQVTGFTGDYWVCTMNFSALTLSKQRELTAFFGRLKGMFGTVKVPTFLRYRTDNIGSPVIDSAVAQAESMAITGVTANVLAFSAGDYITVSDELFEITADASSDLFGDVVVDVNKRIRQTITPGTAVEYQNPYCVMRLTNDTVGLSGLDALFGSSIASFTEAI